MKKFTRDYRIPHYKSLIFDSYFEGRKPCVFDIETTGLSRSSCKVILTAMLVPTENGVRVTQFLAENAYEENRVLEATLDFFESEQIDYLITYNGASFDLPFFNARCVATHLERSINLYDFDLYAFLRKHSCLPDRLQSMSQKSVERYFGIAKTREDTISGKESVKLYNEYAHTGNTVLEKLILTHNREDVVQLYTLLLRAGADDFEQIRKCCLHETLASFGFPGDECILRTNYDYRREILRINGDQLCHPTSIELYRDKEPDYSVIFDRELRSITANIKLNTYDEIPFINIKALELEDELRELENYENGYLILGNSNGLDYETINAFAKAFIRKIRCSYC